MPLRIPADHNYRTDCPAAIKAKITLLEDAAQDYAWRGAQHPDDQEAILTMAQVARYNLERTILTCIEAAVAAALDPNMKRTK